MGVKYILMSFFRDQLEISTSEPANPDSLYRNGSQQSFLSRLEMLESNLTRVTNQHEALIPLLDLVELLPHIQKNLEQSQQAKQRLEALSEQMQDFHSALKQNINHGALSSLDSNFKSLTTQIQDLKHKVKDLEGEHVTNQKVLSQKMKE